MKIVHGKTDWDKLKKLSESDITKAAKSDPDTYILTKKELSKFKRVHSPQEVDVRKIRNKLHLTQKEFAGYFAVSERTIQEWEQGRRAPTATAKNFLQVIEREPKAVQRALLCKKSEEKENVKKIDVSTNSMKERKLRKKIESHVSKNKTVNK